MAVIGSGPGGIGASLQLWKEGLPFVLFGDSIGGLLRYARRVENLPGIPAQSGVQISSCFQEQLEAIGADYRRERVQSIEYAGDEFVLHYPSGTLTASNIILATGTTPRRIPLNGAVYGIDNPEKHIGEKWLVVGGGDIAFDNALRLHDHGVIVAILCRSEPKANFSLIREVREAGISVLRGSAEDIKKQNDVYIFGGYEYEAVAAFVGREPDRSLVSSLPYGEVRFPHGKTDINGLYIIGDAALPDYRQCSVASAMGVAAAMHIKRKMRGV